MTPFSGGWLFLLEEGRREGAATITSEHILHSLVLKLSFEK
jgi:hypothetical protein